MLTVQAQPKDHHSIEKAQITWPATKTQMSVSAILIVISCFVAYGSTLKMGFLLDDYLHLDYSARALTGDFGPLLNNLFSNWGGSDIMKSYRPVVSLSIFIDYLLFHIHAFGYHYTNIVIFCCCALMVALITLEITARLGSRNGALAALWAGLLFSVYPLHGESVAWIIGRVDTLATAFYLASLYCFLRLELLKEKVYIFRSLLFFVLALASKETAVSLPVAIAMLALLPPSTIDKREKEKTKDLKFGRQLISRCRHAFIATLPYIVTLAAFALLRHLLIGTTIGGYGGGGAIDIFHSLKIFGDKDSLTKIFVPVSEEYLPVRTLSLFCTLPVIVAAVLFALRQLISFARGKQSPSAFSGPIFSPLATFVWLSLALFPAFQIWHIYPNLVGSRLFFLSSAGLCLSLSLLALPALERTLPTRLSSIFTFAGACTLSILYLTWFYALQINLTPWEKASDLLFSFETQLKEKVFSTASKKVVILNLPQDYKGAGMLGRKLYLDILNRPPFLGTDLSSRLAVLEPRITGSREYVWPDELRAAGANENNLILLWSNSDGQLHPFDAREATANNDQTLSLQKSLDKIAVIAADHWQSVDKKEPVLRVLADGWNELSSPAPPEANQKSELVIWLDQTIDPRNQKNRLLTLDVQDDQDIGMTGRCQVLWRSANKASSSAEVAGAADAFIDRHEGKDTFDRYVFDLGRYRSYLFSPGPLQIGLRFDLSSGPVRFQPASLRLLPGSALIPAIKMDKTGTAIIFDAANLVTSSAENKTRTFDQLQFFVTESGVTVDPSTELDLYQPAPLDKAKAALTLPLTDKNLKGSVALYDLAKNIGPEPVKSSAKNKIRQIVLRLVSKDGKVKSLCSQPLTVSTTD